MFRLHINSKKGIAAILLAFFVFILAEKNAHGHRGAIADKTGQGQAFLLSKSSCIICDFQLAAGAELPVQPELNAATEQTTEFVILTSSFYLQSSPSCLSERGPPFSC
ncbi:MAG: hypothetical protein ACT4OJ_05940 [Bacteroidota bacterium]